jgi:hypothetical protein
MKNESISNDQNVKSNNDINNNKTNNIVVIEIEEESSLLSIQDGNDDIDNSDNSQRLLNELPFLIAFIGCLFFFGILLNASPCLNFLNLN